MKAFVLGFWIISIALVLSFSMPCYAQVATEGFFTPEGTSWKVRTGTPGEYFHLGFLSDYIWICDDKITCIQFDDFEYKNRLLSKFYASNCSEPSLMCYTLSGYVIPLLRFGKLQICITTDQVQQCVNYPMTRDDNFTYIP